jgi:hypothetical protein
MSSVYIIAFVVTTMIAGGAYMYFLYVKPKRPAEPGPEFVFVEKDGMVRELTADEELFLERNFYPGDPLMPFIKRSYGEKNNEGNLAGFIPRNKIPKEILIQKKDYSAFNPN